MHAAGAHDEVQAGREQDCDQDVGAEHERVGRCFRQHGEQGEKNQRRCADDLQDRRRRTDRILQLGRIADRALRPAEQAVRTHDEHDRHHDELGDQRELGEVHGEAAEIHDADADAQRLDLGDDDGGEIRAADRAHAADHDDNERVADHGEVHQQVGRLAGDLHGAAEAGEECAERKDGREQHGLIDAERADHLPVLGRGAHEPPEAGAGEREVECDQHDRAHRDQEQVVARKPPAEDIDRAPQARSARTEQIFRSPYPKHGVVDDQHQREGREQLEQFRRLVDAPQQHDLDHGADGGDDDRGRDNAAPEAEPAAHLRGEGVGEIGAQHVERAVRDIDDAGDAEDQREAGGHKKQPRCRSEPVEGLKEEGIEGHTARRGSGSM